MVRFKGAGDEHGHKASEAVTSSPESLAKAKRADISGEDKERPEPQSFSFETGDTVSLSKEQLESLLKYRENLSQIDKIEPGCISFLVFFAITEAYSFSPGDKYDIVDLATKNLTPALKYSISIPVATLGAVLGGYKGSDMTRAISKAFKRRTARKTFKRELMQPKLYKELKRSVRHERSYLEEKARNEEEGTESD